MRWYKIYSLNDEAIKTFQKPDMIQDYRDIVLFIMVGQCYFHDQLLTVIGISDSNTRGTKLERKNVPI